MSLSRSAFAGRAGLALGFVLVGVVALPACPAPGEGEGDAGEGEGEGEGRTTFGWQRRDDVNVPALWGAIVSDGDDDDHAFVVGGVADDLGPVVSEIQDVHLTGASLRSSSVLSTNVPRFCGCAMFDEQRRELIVVGGRDGAFLDVESVFVVNVDTGASDVIADAAPAQHPIGCQAFFVDGVDRGVVFSGLSSNDGEFGADTYEWNPETRAFSVVDVGGADPAPRYDASTHRVDDTRFLMVGGMGLAGNNVVFYSEVWTFDAAAHRWSEIEATTDAPPGRRYPWAALSVADDTLLYGYGSDSPTGDTMIADLWRFTLSTGEWSVVDVDGEVPAARGFVYRLPGAPGTAGTLNAGLGQNQQAATDAFVLLTPGDLAGPWR